MSDALQTFREAIHRLPGLVVGMYQEIEPRVRLLLSTPQIYGLRQIVLTGSGDSYIAACAAAPAFRAWTGLPVQAMTAMEASRYLTLGTDPAPERLRGALIVCISHSGEAARVIEAAHRVKHAGAWAVGVTANPDSRLGKAVSVVLNVVSQDSSTAPGTASYCASLVALYLLAIRIAEVRMRFTMDVANGLRQKLAALGQPMLAALAVCEAPLAECAESWALDRMVDVLGSGPGGGAAAYTAAKLVEAAGVHASYQDLEEFFHLNYFVAAPESVPAVVFAPSCGAGASRATELLRALGELGRPCLVISDSTTFGPQGQATAGQIAAPARVVALPPVEELLTPVLGIIPAALLAAFWADRSGAEHYRGHSGPWQPSRGAALVRSSRIELSLADVAPDGRRR